MNHEFRTWFIRYVLSLHSSSHIERPWWSPPPRTAWLHFSSNDYFLFSFLSLQNWGCFFCLPVIHKHCRRWRVGLVVEDWNTVGCLLCFCALRWVITACHSFTLVDTRQDLTTVGVFRWHCCIFKGVLFLESDDSCILRSSSACLGGDSYHGRHARTSTPKTGDR